MSWKYYTMDSHTLKDKMPAWTPNVDKALTSPYMGTLVSALFAFGADTGILSIKVWESIV